MLFFFCLLLTSRRLRAAGDINPSLPLSVAYKIFYFINMPVGGIVYIKFRVLIKTPFITMLEAIHDKVSFMISFHHDKLSLSILFGNDFFTPGIGS